LFFVKTLVCLPVLRVMPVTESTTPTAEQLIREHQDSVWRFLVSLGCDASLADDLTQEAFLAVLRGGFEYKGPRETIAWLLRVAKNQFIDVIRNRKETVADLGDAEARWQEFEGECEYGQRVAWLRECMNELTDRAREAVKLRYELNLPREEMASRLGIAAAGVKTMLERIRQRLRECVQGKVDNDRD
jgi:RNA polymerase sigma-70 factor, ECF subfamily